MSVADRMFDSDALDALKTALAEQCACTSAEQCLHRKMRRAIVDHFTPRLQAEAEVTERDVDDHLIAQWPQTAFQRQGQALGFRGAIQVVGGMSSPDAQEILARKRSTT